MELSKLRAERDLRYRDAVSRVELRSETIDYVSESTENANYLREM